MAWWKTTIFIGALAGLFHDAHSQAADTIFLANPSFEADVALFSQDTAGWVDCGFLSEAPAAVQPGQYDVRMAAKDQRYYMSLVVRENYTWDAIGQKLEKPLEPGKCYEWTIYLAQSPHYFDYARRHAGKVRYNNPIQLFIWGGSGFCQAGQLLAETEVVKHKNWQPYRLVLRPQKPVYYLTLHAYYLNPLAKAYNGHILIDNASHIVSIPCPDDMEAPIDAGKVLTLSPPSVEALERYISLHGPHIVFSPKKLELEENNDADFFRPEYLSYAHMSVIAKGLRWFSGQKLVIGVKAHPRRQVGARVEYLVQYLRDRGLKPEQYSVIPYDEAGAMEWLAESPDLGMTLMEGEKGGG